MQVRRRALSVVLRSAGLLLSLSLIAACSDKKPITSRGSSPTSTSTALTKTAVVHVRPVDDQGRLRSDFSVHATIEGATCAGNSVKVGELAHRCEAGTGLYDPCWTETDGPGGPSVLCMGQPWSREVERLMTKTKIAPAPPTPGFDVPWGVELANGKQCRFATGAHDSVGDDVVDYYCDDPGPGLALLRSIRQTDPVWTARAVRYANGRYEPVDAQPIATAWF